MNVSLCDSVVKYVKYKEYIIAEEEDEEEEEEKDVEKLKEEVEKAKAKEKEKKGEKKEENEKGQKGEEEEMDLKGVFRFHNVGQGLFYSGILNQEADSGKRQQTVCFVYDCGTNSSKNFLKKEIDDFKLLMPASSKGTRKKLDLLVVSHLHDDHVNGLELLLKNVDVNTVVMPYVNEGINFLARLESHNNDEFLQLFYTDPVGWFVSKGVRRIFLLGAEEQFDKNKNIEGDNINWNDSVILAEEDGVLNIEVKDGVEVVYLKRRAKIELQDIKWEFIFENLKKDADKTQSFIEAVEQFKRENLTTLEQIFKSKQLLKDLKKVLAPIYPNGNAINRTSVVLLHGPVGCNNIAIINGPVFCLNKITWTNGHTVLTGDLFLKDDESIGCLNSILDDIDTCATDEFFAMQYPHHGSKDNNFEYFSKIYTCINILSFGITNGYGHPNADILEELPHVVCVNERTAFDYQIIC